MTALRSATAAKSLLALVTLLAATVAPNTLRAAPVTLDFNDWSFLSGSNSSNQIYRGFRLSPNCHFDAERPGGYEGSTFIGFDAGGCGGGRPPGSDFSYNPDWLGPLEYRGPIEACCGRLFVDYAENPFSLLSVYVPINEFFGSVMSSKGGIYTVDSNSDPGTFIEFSGSDWTGVKWLIFVGGSGAPRGFDHLTLRVPAPSSLCLALLALALCAPKIRAATGVSSSAA